MSLALEQFEADPPTLRGADVAFLSPYGISHQKRFGGYGLDLKRLPGPRLGDPLSREALRQVRRRIAAQASQGFDPETTTIHNIEEKMESGGTEP